MSTRVRKTHCHKKNDFPLLHKNNCSVGWIAVVIAHSVLFLAELMKVGSRRQAESKPVKQQTCQRNRDHHSFDIQPCVVRNLCCVAAVSVNLSGGLDWKQLLFKSFGRLTFQPNSNAALLYITDQLQYVLPE